jgi:hypothetical protein
VFGRLVLSSAPADHLEAMVALRKALANGKNRMLLLDFYWNASFYQV